MKTSTSLARKTAAFAAAMMIVLSGAGSLAATGVVSDTAVMTAVAAENYTLNQQSFGMKTPADSVKVYHGGVLVSTYTWDNLLNGINVSGSNNTIELVYPDSSLVYDVATKHLLECTRTSGISREEYYITYETAKNFLIGNDFGHYDFYVYDTQRSPLTGRTGNFIFNENLAEEDFPVTLDYTLGTDVYIISANRNNAYLQKYDIEAQAVTGTKVQMGGMFNNAKMNPKAFDVPAGFESVTVNGVNTLISNNDYGYGESFSSVLYTASEWNSGKCDLNYMISSFDVNRINRNLQVVFRYPNGGTIEYTYICDTPYLDSWNYIPENLKDNNNQDKTDKDGNPAVDGKDETSGKPVITDETVSKGDTPPTGDGETGETENDYTVTVYKGAAPIETMTGKQYENGKYVIEDYSPEYNYYVKVEYADGSGDYKMYRYNAKIGGALEERVDTKAAPEITVPIDLSMFPKEKSGGFATENGVAVVDWTVEDFLTSKTALTLPTKYSEDYDFTFSYPKASYDYTLIGIDPELKSGIGDKGCKATDVKTDADTDDTLHVTGKTEDGNITLPDGDYTVEDKDTRIKGDVTVDGDDSEGKAGSVGEDGKYNSNGENGEKKGDDAELNLTEPKYDNHYKVTAPDGEVLDEGEFEDGVFDNIKDTNLKKEDITKYPYVEFEAVSGQTNSTNPDDFTDEHGYIYDVDVDGDFVFADNSKLMLGDVNLDGKISVKDVVLMQKYLLNKESFKFELFFNADMNGDGKANVFDFILLKQLLLKK